MSGSSLTRSSLRNTQDRYGWITIVLHWVLAVSLIALYFLGDYMVDLGYYDTWYHRAPQIHKEVGVMVGILMLLRLLWNMFQTSPKPLDETTVKANRLAKLAHYMLYGLVFLMVISGYLISTAKGQGIDVFGLFELPAFLPNDKDRGELAGEIHELMGAGFMILVGLHALAALGHHFFFKDGTLKRMLWIKKGES